MYCFVFIIVMLSFFTLGECRLYVYWTGSRTYAVVLLHGWESPKFSHGFLTLLIASWDLILDFAKSAEC